MHRIAAVQLQATRVHTAGIQAQRAATRKAHNALQTQAAQRGWHTAKCAAAAARCPPPAPPACPAARCSCRAWCGWRPAPPGCPRAALASGRRAASRRPADATREFKGVWQLWSANDQRCKESSAAAGRYPKNRLQAGGRWLAAQQVARLPLQHSNVPRHLPCQRSNRRRLPAIQPRSMISWITHFRR